MDVPVQQLDFHIPPNYMVKAIGKTRRIIQNGISCIFYFFAMTVKIVALVIFIAILASLGSALFHLVKRGDQEQSAKTAKALTYRISLSLVLFILLFVAYATGIFKPSGIGSRIQQTHSLNSQQSAPKP